MNKLLKSYHAVREFLEFHTQIYGTGRMQKFHANDFNTLYEDVLMSPGDKLPAHLNCLLRRGKRQEATVKGLGEIRLILRISALNAS
jgi:hypothetical protein